MAFENQSPAFSEALDYLYSFINFERRPQDRYMASKMDATRPKRMMDALGAPYADYPTIHIAGTKGKGSVAAMCAACLRAAGLRVGLYTSPHLVDFRERIRIMTPEDSWGLIPEDDFVAMMARIRRVEPDFPGITWFELLTAVAFLHFATRQVDVAVIEVGLGGRLDATNVLTPLVSVITRLSLDHTKLLGNTLTQIAFEKGGIIKPGVPLVTAPQEPEAMAELRSIAAQRGAPLTAVGEAWQYKMLFPASLGAPQQIQLTRSTGSLLSSPEPIAVNLLGVHQAENGAVALAALSIVQPHFPTLTETAVRQGLRDVEWNGRLQILHPGDDQTPTLLIDGAHNPDSAEKLRQALTTLFDYQHLCLILGAPSDKDISGVLDQLLPIADQIICTAAEHPRAISPDDLVALCAEKGFTAVAAVDSAAALQLAWSTAQPASLICATGSLILLGDLLNQWERLKSTLR